MKVADDWKKNLSLYLQFSNPLLNRESLKSHIQSLKNKKLSFSPYDEVLIEIITNKKAYLAIEKMNFLFPKYLIVYFCDILFEYNALLTEPIEHFEMRNFQEQNIVDFLKFLQGPNLELNLSFPFMTQLRYLDSLRSSDNPNKNQLNSCHEFMCSTLILSKTVDYNEEKIREILKFIEKLDLSPDLDLKTKIIQVKYMIFN